MVLTLSGQAVFTMIVEYDIEKNHVEKNHVEKNHVKKNHRGIKKTGKEKWRDLSSTMCQTLLVSLLDSASPCFGHFFNFMQNCKIFMGAVTEPVNPSMVVGYLPSIMHIFSHPCIFWYKFLTVYLQYWNVTTLELGVGTSTSHCFLDSCGKH